MRDDLYDGQTIQWADTSDPTSWEPTWRSCHWALLPFHIGIARALDTYRCLFRLGWRPWSDGDKKEMTSNESRQRAVDALQQDDIAVYAARVANETGGNGNG